MKKSQGYPSLSLFLLLSIAIALYLSLYFQSSSFTIVNHSYVFSPLLFVILMAGAFFILVLIRFSLKRFDKKYFNIDQPSHGIGNLLPYLPLFFFFLAPILLEHYLNKNDLKVRLNLLAFSLLCCFAYLILVRSNRYLIIKDFLEKTVKKFSGLSIKKRLLVLFCLAFVIYNGCTFILVSKGISFSGDEPYYLLTTHSLLKDKDINVANNYANRDYYSFYSKEEIPRFRLGMYARAGRKGGEYIYPINLPGVSFLMLPFYWLSQFFSGKVLTFILKGSLSIWAALLGVQLYLLSKELWQKEKVSLILWFFYSFSSPVLFYAIHLYPEIPIALFSIIIYRKIRSEKHLSIFNYFFLGFLLSSFFWFGLKYNMIFWPLLIVSVYFLLKNHKARLKILCFLAFPLLSLALFYLYLYEIYGSFYPFAIYEGVMTPEKMHAFKQTAMNVPISMRIDTLFDYFLDQRDGILLYAPFYFFVFLGLVEAFRKARKDLFILLFITLPFILSYAFFTHRQGYCPQGRILAPISWVGAVFIGYFIFHNKRKIYSFIFWVFYLISLGTVVILLGHPDFLYQPTTHEFTSRPGGMFAFLSNINIFLPNFLPSFIKVKNTGYLPNYLWVLAVIAFVIIYVFIKRKIHLNSYFHFSFSIVLLAVFFFLWVLYPRPVLYPHRTFHYSVRESLGFYFFPMGKGVVTNDRGELYLHREGAYRILFTSRRRLEKVKLVFGSESGGYDVKMSCFDISFFNEKTNYEKKEITLKLPAYYPFKKLYLYEVHLDLKKLSSESMLKAPYFFKLFPSR